MHLLYLSLVNNKNIKVKDNKDSIEKYKEFLKLSKNNSITQFEKCFKHFENIKHTWLTYC